MICTMCSAAKVKEVTFGEKKIEIENDVVSSSKTDSSCFMSTE